MAEIRGDLPVNPASSPTEITLARLQGLRNDIDPEPCDNCENGIMYLICFDGRRLCRNCTRSIDQSKELIPKKPYFIQPVRFEKPEVAAQGVQLGLL